MYCLSFSAAAGNARKNIRAAQRPRNARRNSRGRNRRKRRLLNAILRFANSRGGGCYSRFFLLNLFFAYRRGGTPCCRGLALVPDGWIISPSPFGEVRRLSVVGLRSCRAGSYFYTHLCVCTHGESNQRRTKEKEENRSGGFLLSPWISSHLSTDRGTPPGCDCLCPPPRELGSATLH